MRAPHVIDRWGLLLTLLSCSCIPLHDYYLVTPSDSPHAYLAEVQEKGLTARFSLVGTPSGTSLVLEFSNDSASPVEVALREITLRDATRRFLATRFVDDRFFHDPEPLHVDTVPTDPLLIPPKQEGNASRKAFKLYFPMDQPLFFPLMRRYPELTVVIPSIVFVQSQTRITWTVPFHW